MGRGGALVGIGSGGGPAWTVLVFPERSDNGREDVRLFEASLGGKPGGGGGPVGWLSADGTGGSCRVAHGGREGGPLTSDEDEDQEALSLIQKSPKA